MDKSEFLRKKINFKENTFVIPFRPANINNLYAVNFTIESNKIVKQLSYEVSVKWLKTDINGICAFEITRISDFYIDGNKLNTLVDKLAQKTAKVIYPLQILINQKGKWIRVFNYDEILKRWGDIKNEILDSYNGKDVLEYLNEVKYTLESENRFLIKLTSDWFLRAFFNGVNTDYTADFKFNKDIYFPILTSKEDINFEVEHTIDDYLDENNLIVIEQNGTLSKNQIDSEFAAKGLLTGSYVAKYHLNPNHYLVEKLKLKCEVKTLKSKKIIIEIYNLNQNYALDTR